MSRSFKFAFKKTIPIMTGFIFLGIAYGIYMHQLGFNFLYPTLMALLIFGGSVEFVIAGLLLQSFDPLAVFILTLIINSRHLFYGISMLDNYNVHGLKKFYMIFCLCDETFSINYFTKVPKDINKIDFMFWVTVLNQFYWVLGAFLGGVLGNFIKFEFSGLDFVMTALFLVLFIDQVIRENDHFSSYMGVIVSLVALAIFGPDIFMPISMIVAVLIFYLRYSKNKKVGDLNELD